jgi:hypothetical protein
MKNLLACLALCGLPLLGFTGEQKEEEPPKPVPVEAVDDERIGGTIAKGQLLVTLHEGIKEEELKPLFERMEAKFQIVDRIESMNHYTLVTDHERLPELRQRLENHPYVAAASFNRLVSLKRVFNDPIFNKPKDMPEDKDNWNLFRIKAPEAWDITTGGAVVAVIDSGAVLEHEDLDGRLVNPYSFATLSPSMQMGMKKIKYGPNNFENEEVRNHGTHVAITIGGKADNALGTAGIAPTSPIMPLQALTYRPLQGEDAGLIRGYDSDITKALTRAMDNNVAVINMSLGGVDPQLLRDWRAAKDPLAKQEVGRKLLAQADNSAKTLAPWLDRANRAGIILVVAAGNDDIPAEFGAYALSRRVVSVAATTREDKRANFTNPDDLDRYGWGSNYGPYTTVSAPGHDIWSGWAEPGKAYSYSQGTSMACPHVAGVVALMKTLNPDLKLAEVVDILVMTGRPLSSDQPIGPLVNAKAALDEVRLRLSQGVPRQPDLPPIITPPIQNPSLPRLPIDGVEILRQPDPWNNPDVQRIIQVWLSIALPRPPAGGNPDIRWFFNINGQVVNVRTALTIERPIWVQFSYRWLWENALTLESTNMGSLYEFLVGTLRIGTFNPAPPRVPEKFRPRPDDPKPRPGGWPFDPILRDTKWAGRNLKGETLEMDFDAKAIKITRGGTTVVYKVRMNTFLNPATIDFYPEAGGDPVFGLVQMVNLGEILLRTDFTNKRPTTISRGDPLTFLLKRTDIQIVQPGSNDDGVEMGVIHRGIETLLVSYPLKDLPKGARQPIWTLPDGFGLHHYALSGDGRRLWVLLHNGVLDFKGDRWQLWSMAIDGKDAKQAFFKRHQKAVDSPTVLTNRDGSVAWIFSPKLEPFWDIHHVELLHVTPGGQARVVADTKEIKGVSRGGDPQLSGDGRTLSFQCLEGLFQVKDDGSHKFAVLNKDIVYQGTHLFPGERLTGLVTNEAGTRWAAKVTFPLLKGPEKNVALIGNGNHIHFHAEKDWLDHVSMSADGKTVLIQRGGRPKVNLLLWRDGKVKPIMPDVASVYSGVLSGDGNTLYAVCNVYGTTGFGMSGFLEDLTTGRRRMAMTHALGAHLLKTGRSIQLSHEGSVVTSVSTGMFEFAPWGLYVCQDRAAPPADYPQIKSVRQRYEGSKLIVTVEVESSEPLHRVFATPLRYGYLNPAHLTQEQGNPLFHMKGLPGGHDLYPLPKRPNHFELIADLGNKHALLDHTYSIRIVAVNAGRNRATFQDVGIQR